MGIRSLFLRNCQAIYEQLPPVAAAFCPWARHPHLPLVAIVMV
jgi:hypothetical protein